MAGVVEVALLGIPRRVIYITPGDTKFFLLVASAIPDGLEGQEAMNAALYLYLYRKALILASELLT